MSSPTETYFRVGDAFKTDDASIRGLQFALAVQPFVTHARALRHEEGPDDLREADTGQMLFAALVATKEAADIFRQADRVGSFCEIETSHNVGLSEDLALVRKECDTAEESRSLYREVLYKIRHSVAHWKFEPTKKALDGLKDDNVVVLRGGSEFLTSTIPLLNKLAAAIASLGGDPDLSAEDRQHQSVETSRRLVKLQGAMMRVAEAFYTLSLARAGVLSRKTE